MAVKVMVSAAIASAAVNMVSAAAEMIIFMKWLLSLCFLLIC
jgi:hypothetical protein